MNLNLLTTTSRQRCGDFVPTLALIWVESYSVVYQGWLKASFLQLVGNMISRGASGNPLFTTQKIVLYTSIYGKFEGENNTDMSIKVGQHE